MQRAVPNRATMRVADTTEVSGRVTVDSIKHELSVRLISKLALQHCFNNWNSRDADAIVASFAERGTYSDPAWSQRLRDEASAKHTEERDRNRGPNKKACRKPLAVAVLVFAVVQVCTDLAAHAQSLSQGRGDLRVMTYNIDEGTDFIEIQQATNATQFLIAVGQTITQVRATNPAARMQAVAKQIIAAAPALVSLQEVDQWSTGPFDPVTNTFGPGTIEFDMLPELLAALAAQGGHYKVAALANQYAFSKTPGLILPSTFLWVQVSDDDVILARTDLDMSKFQWSNVQSGQFAHFVSITTPIGTVPLPRAWCSVDVNFNGRIFRFINTHLESFDVNIRELQGAELRAGPANTSLPVVVAMDSNSQAFPFPQDPTYADFIAAGYKDAWTEIFPSAPGLTCCQAQFVNNPLSQLYQRIDLILTLGSVEAQNISLFGADPVAKTPGGLWPSDHAAVAAQLVVEKTLQ